MRKHSQQKEEHVQKHRSVNVHVMPEELQLAWNQAERDKCQVASNLDK
jgi:hypothetical protein